jgi:ABC-type nitrate/sulfonate/bicarbonate transport system permease component
MRSPRADVVRTDIAHHGEDMMKSSLGVLVAALIIATTAGPGVKLDSPITGSSGPTVQALFVAVVILAGVGVVSVIGLQKLERWLAPWREFAVRT